MIIRTMNVSALKVVRGLLKVCTALRAASRDFWSSFIFTDGLRFLATFFAPLLDTFQFPRHEFVERACNEGLVGHSFLCCLFLQAVQVA